MLTLTMGGRANKQLRPQNLRLNSVSQTLSTLADLIRWSQISEKERRVSALRQQEQFKEQAFFIEQQTAEKPFKTPTEEVFETVMLNIPFELEKYDADHTTRKTYDTLQEIINHDDGNNKKIVVLNSDSDSEPIQHTFDVLESIINDERPGFHRQSRVDTSILGVLNRLAKSIKTNGVTSNDSKIVMTSEGSADVLFLLHKIIPQTYINNVTIVESVKKSIINIVSKFPGDGDLTEEQLKDILPQILSLEAVVGDTDTDNIMKLAQLLKTLNIAHFSLNGTSDTHTEIEDSSSSHGQDGIGERSSTKPVIFIDGGE